jgi:perosamine synthetase
MKTPGSVLEPQTESRTLIQMPGVQTRLNRAEEEVLVRVLREANTLATGPEGAAFEKEFTQMIGCADSVALSSCSSALEVAAILSKLKAGDEVIMPAHTFVASTVPFARHGVTIRWADIEPETWVISPESVARLITARTKLILVVHLYGLVVDMDPILDLVKGRGIMVVEDCAQAPGGHYKGRRAGSLGDFGCFSFHTHKNISTLGEGGMLTVRNPQHAVAARRIRWMGNWPFEMEREFYWQPAMGDIVEPVPGQWPHNFCMGEPNCAVGRLLIKRLDAINSRRRVQAKRMISALADYPELTFQEMPAGREHSYHLLPAKYEGSPSGKNRNDLIQLVWQKYNLKLIVQYWPLNRAELFRKFGFEQADIPVSDDFFAKMISFPWW